MNRLWRDATNCKPPSCVRKTCSRCHFSDARRMASQMLGFLWGSNTFATKICRHPWMKYGACCRNYFFCCLCSRCRADASTPCQHSHLRQCSYTSDDAPFPCGFGSKKGSVLANGPMDPRQQMSFGAKLGEDFVYWCLVGNEGMIHSNYQ